MGGCEHVLCYMSLYTFNTYCCKVTDPLLVEIVLAVVNRRSKSFSGVSSLMSIRSQLIRVPTANVKPIA